MSLLSRSFLLLAGALGGLLPDNQNWTCHINRRIGSHNDANYEGKSKIMNDTTPKCEKGYDDYQRGRRSKERPAQGFINAAVDDGLIRLPVILAGVFPNAVKHDDGVIERIPYDCQ